jgi:hypothetical protein
MNTGSIINADAVQQLYFRAIPEQAIALAETAQEPIKRAQAALQSLPGDDLDTLYYNPDAHAFALFATDDFREAATPVLTKIAMVTENAQALDGIWIPAMQGFAFQKRALLEPGWERAVLRTPGHLSMVFPNAISRHLPAAGSPLTSTLAGGLVGAGLGYSVGALGERMLPEKWERGKLRRTLAIMGGLGGAAPGALSGALNLSNNKSLLDPNPWFVDPVPFKEVKASVKEALFDYAGAMPPPLPVQEFTSTIWADPRVSNALSPQQQAAITGLVQGAAYDGGRRTAFITPMDIGRMTAGMGSGYLSGMLVGKALGALTGMPESTQNRLKQTGMYAGVIANLLPVAFGV